MARKGRPRKAGKRTASGRRIPDARTHDRGTERVQALRDVYGEHYGSALGRAFVRGLLGDPMQAQARLDAGKRFARIHARVIWVRGYRCPLNDAPRGGNPDLATFDQEQHDHDLAEQAWLFDAMARLDRDGSRPWLDQLVSDIYHDRDPYWLARLLAGGKHPADLMLLNAAIRALDILAPSQKAVRVLVAA